MESAASRRYITSTSCRGNRNGMLSSSSDYGYGYANVLGNIFDTIPKSSIKLLPAK